MILITGSSGFVGRHLISRLIKSKYNVCCLVRDTSDKKFIAYLKKNSIKLIFGSLTDYASIFKSLEHSKISQVIHLAGILVSNSKDDYININVKATSNLIKLCKKKKVNKIIFVSSDVAAKRELTIYGQSKYLAELIIKKSGIAYVILRPTVIYGKGDSKFVMKLVDIIRRYPLVPVIGDGNYIFQPVFIDDIVHIIIKCLNMNSKKTRDKTYNVCCDEILTLNKIIDTISYALNKKVYKIHVPLFLLKPVVKIYELVSKNPSITTQQLNYFPVRTKLDNKLIKKDLNFEFIKFRDGILKSI